MFLITVYIFAGSVAATLFGWYFRRTNRFDKLLRKIPGPPLIPVVGSCFDLWGGLDRKFYSEHDYHLPNHIPIISSQFY